jgi:hypothetical protein
LKKPAASTQQVAKKPASKAAIPKSSMWKLAHSRLFHQTRKAEMAKHGDDNTAKMKASKACATAKVEFFNGELAV